MQRNVSPITAIVIILLALGIAALAWVRLSTGPKPMSEQDRAGRRQGTSVRRGGGGGGRGGGGGGRRGAGSRRGGGTRGERGGGRQNGAPATQAKPGGGEESRSRGVEESKGTATAGTKSGR